MSELNINVEGGSSTKLLTAGKYCPDDIIITASGGGGGEFEPIELTGDQSYALRDKIGAFAINTLGNKISTKGITTTNCMFYGNKVEKIPFEINCDNSTYRDMGAMFSNCSNLKELPNINNAYPYMLREMFQLCDRLKYIPDDFCNDWNFDRLHTYTSSNISSMFNNCRSLRKISKSFLSNLWGISTSYFYTLYSGGFNGCYALDEIRDIPIHQGELTSNAFRDTFFGCCRVKDITFETNEDGTAKTARWKSQTINLSDGTYGTGYAGTYVWNSIPSEKYNSGITMDDEVKDDATYQALKDSPNWWTKSTYYSRYNHDSAVNTINSLPDTSAYLAEKGGTNTIQFYGIDGANTDGGATNTLTDAEIAVAAAKGWTVSIKHMA